MKQSEKIRQEQDENIQELKAAHDAQVRCDLRINSLIFFKKN